MSVSEEVKKETTSLLVKCNAFLRADNFAMISANIALKARNEKILSRTVANEDIAHLMDTYNALSDDLKHSVINSVEAHFRGTLFVDLISSVEIYFANVIKIVVSENPQKLGSTEFKLNDILDKSREELISEAADKYVYKVMYKKAKEVLRELCKTISIKEERLEQFWSAFIESKARRDLGVHNNWLCNDTYIRKVQEAGLKPQVDVGSPLTPNEKGYTISVVECIRGLANAINDSVAEKYS
ncbi:hypothetical protein [Vibrio harveyi]|uniref:hypothetical protein n=1 Tax=Vibrio harveyi TaxID=669 RepID=UPI00066DEDF0|nr:hypothetical protein [Vibrio harveyi]